MGTNLRELEYQLHPEQRESTSRTHRATRKQHRRRLSLVYRPSSTLLQPHLELRTMVPTFVRSCVIVVRVSFSTEGSAFTRVCVPGLEERTDGS